MKVITKYESKDKKIYDTQDEAERADIIYDLNSILSEEAIDEIMEQLEEVKKILKTEVIVYRDRIYGTGILPSPYPHPLDPFRPEPLTPMFGDPQINGKGITYSVNIGDLK